MKLVGDEYQEVPGWYAGYTLGGPQIFGKEGFLPPTRTIKEETRMTIAGVDVDLIPVAGETARCPPRLAAKQESPHRDSHPLRGLPGYIDHERQPPEGSAGLREQSEGWPEASIPSTWWRSTAPTRSRAEQMRSANYLTNFSDAIQFLNDQTVQYLNRGFTPGEMEELIVLPPHLASSPYLEETYGSKEWDVFHIFRYYRGLYTGEVRDLFPQSTESEARMSEFLVERRR